MPRLVPNAVTFSSLIHSKNFPLGKPGRNKDESILDGNEIRPLCTHVVSVDESPGPKFRSEGVGGWSHVKRRSVFF